VPNVLDALRQPLEAGETVIARANHRIAYPSRIQLVAAMNPCKCGGSTPGQSCRRGPRCADDYQARISGPLLDRIDLQIEVPALSPEEITATAPGEASSSIGERVEAARRIQRERFRRTHVQSNAEMSARQLRRFCELDPPSRRLLEQALARLGLSARAYDRILKVARTIADLAASDRIEAPHLLEAIQYRSLDRNLFY